jgi:flagellar biosynthetic protein FliQ
MNPIDVATIWQEALYLIVMLVVIIILPSLMVGLIVSTFQAATQINEQTLSFLPRLLTTLFAIMIAGPYLLQVLLDYTHNLIANIPFMVF